MGWESFGVVGFDLGLLLQVQTRIAKLKSAHNSYNWLYRFGMSNQLTGNHGPESFYVVRFDLGPLL